MRTCRNLLLVVLLVAFAMLAARSMAGIGATEAWVANYVSNYVAQTASELAAKTTIADSNGWYVAEVNGYEVRAEKPTERALVCTDATPASAACGITNGVVLAETTNGWRNASLLIPATSTNMWFEANGVRYDGAARGARCWLVGGGVDFAGFALVLISKTYAGTLLAGTEAQ